MKKFLISAILLFIFVATANAQWYASRIYPQPALPATCTANAGEVVFNTTTDGIYQCVAANTWQPVGITGGSLDLAQGILTASDPFIDHTATWNAGAVTFQNFVSNVTDTASAVGSTLMELQVGAAPIFSLRKDGFITVAAGGGFGWLARSNLSSTLDGQLQFLNAAATGFTKLSLGPETIAGVGIIPDVVAGQQQGFIIGNGDGTTLSFAELAAATNGTIVYCDDCTKATPCAGAGTGALAKRYNGAWDCD